VRIDEQAHRAWVADQEIELTHTEFRLLAYLVANVGRLCARTELLRTVWEASPHLNTRTVDTFVRRIRDKLGAASARIETVRGVGYRYEA
jgi:two-component system phosphate regulon response regulator PhoB